MVIGFKISKNYAFEFSALRMMRSLDDGLDLFSFACNFDFYEADHNPQAHSMLVICNFKIFEIGIYNVNHIE